MSQRRRGRRLSEHDEVNDGDGVGADRDTVNACVRFVICREGSKVPIKRTEFVKHLTTACQLPSNRVGPVLAAANKILKKVYGYKLVQVEGKGGTQYIVVSCEDSAGVPSLVTPASHRVLLNAALTHIFMSGGTVKEEDMWKFLKKANLLADNEQSVKKLLTSTFTKQMYLTYGKEGDGELCRYVFRWDQRASEETSKMFILQKMAQAMDKTPDHWAEQNRMAREDVEELIE